MGHSPRLLIVLAASLVVAGCTTQSLPPSPTPPPPPERPIDPAPAEDPRTTPAPPSEPRSDASQATLALLRESERAKVAGDRASAVAYVERAIRLEPRRADLWVELARLQLPDKAQAAERYARKALTLTGSRVDLQRDAWLVIADAKEAKGERAEATVIRDRYRTYRG